jgi:hypothetical protein
MSQYRFKKPYRPYPKVYDKKPSSIVEDEKLIFDYKPEKYGDMSEFIRKQEKLVNVIELKFKFYGQMIMNYEHMTMEPPEQPTVEELNEINDPYGLKLDEYKLERKAHKKTTMEYKENYHGVWAFLWEMTTESLRAKIREYGNFDETFYGDKDPLILWR